MDGWENILQCLGRDSSYCLMKTDCRLAQRITIYFGCFFRSKVVMFRKPIVRVWQEWSQCNHIDAALFRIETAMCLGLSNQSCTVKPCEWLHTSPRT